MKKQKTRWSAFRAIISFYSLSVTSACVAPRYINTFFYDEIVQKDYVGLVCVWSKSVKDAPADKRLREIVETEIEKMIGMKCMSGSNVEIKEGHDRLDVQITSDEQADNNRLIAYSRLYFPNGSPGAITYNFGLLNSGGDLLLYKSFRLPASAPVGKSFDDFFLEVFRLIVTETLSSRIGQIRK